ncbi:MAG: GAF domain-containing protein [Actinomycetes bacterium]
MSDQTPDPTRPRPSDLPAVSRLAAGNALREGLKNTAGLTGISTAAARFIRDFFDADAAAITLMQGEWFRTLVTVGVQSPDEVRLPDGDTYPTSDYPNVARLLRSGSGYIASIGNDGGVRESQKFLTQYKKSTCFAAPISYQGEVVGEVFASRVRGRSYYTGHDLAALLDLARQIGYRIGPAVKAQNQLDPTWWPPDASPAEPPTEGRPLA